MILQNHFSGKDSTKDWCDETIWFDVASYVSVGVKNVCKVFEEALGNLKIL